MVLGDDAPKVLAASCLKGHSWIQAARSLVEGLDIRSGKGINKDIPLVCAPKDVSEDTILTYADVEIDEKLSAFKLRKECETMI